MTDGAELAALWRRLSDNQRVHLMNQTMPERDQENIQHFIMAAKALDRRGLMAPGRGLTREGEALANWAAENGHARLDGKRWMFSTPERPRYRRIDEARLLELAAAGWHGSAIAAELGVSRQLVSLAAKRAGATLAPRPKKEKVAKTPRARVRVERPKRLLVRVSVEEFDEVRREAERRQVSVSEYLRQVCIPQE